MGGRGTKTVSGSSNSFRSLSLLNPRPLPVVCPFLYFPFSRLLTDRLQATRVPTEWHHLKLDQFSGQTKNSRNLNPILKLLGTLYKPLSMVAIINDFYKSRSLTLRKSVQLTLMLMFSLLKSTVVVQVGRKFYQNVNGFPEISCLKLIMISISLSAPLFKLI